MKYNNINDTLFIIYLKDVLRCDIISQQVDNVFEYCKDKNYNPDFSKSKRVYE